ncbi:MAG: hypothetical protein AAGF11_33125 [Myxococcota bacterium]
MHPSKGAVGVGYAIIMKPNFIIRILISSSLAACGLVSVGCVGDDDSNGANDSRSLCDMSAEILVDECGLEVEVNADEDVASCEVSEEEEAELQCVVDFPSETCEAMSNAFDATFTNAYIECIADIKS